MSRSFANSNRWITSPATPIVADTIPCVKSPVSTNKDCGPSQPSGSHNSAQSAVWFSQFGTLLATAETFVNRFPRGYFADELARALHVDVQDSLHQLVQQRRVTRQIVSGLYLYTAIDRTIQQGQLLTRRNVEAVPTVVDASVLEASE